MIPIETKEFRRLRKRDFENGAVQDEIYAALKQRDDLLAEREALWVEGWMQGFNLADRGTIVGAPEAEARRQWMEKGKKWMM